MCDEIIYPFLAVVVLEWTSDKFTSYFNIVWLLIHTEINPL